MEKAKTLEQLRAEKERAETQLAQEQHKLNRLENRKKYLEKGERQKRTHRLCNLGGTIESLAPEVKDLTRTEMTELMEHIFTLSEVQRAVRHMAITHRRSNRQSIPGCWSWRSPGDRSPVPRQDTAAHAPQGNPALRPENVRTHEVWHWRRRHRWFSFHSWSLRYRTYQGGR